jgi:glutamine amidotransferase
MHNGCVASFQKIKRKLISELSDSVFSYIQGTTDSEHVGALFVQKLPNSDPNGEITTEEMKKAMVDAIEHILKLTKVKKFNLT